MTIIEQPRIKFSVASQSVDCNAGSATVRVNVMGSSLQTITIHYATSDISAHAGTDYTSSAGTLTIPAGNTSGTFTVPSPRLHRDPATPPSR